MRVFSVPKSNSSRAKNIARTEGTILAPDAVRSLYETWAAKGVLFCKEDGCPAGLVFADVRLADCGGDVHTFARMAFEKSGEERIAFLGGDHSITHAVFSAFRERHGDRAVIISLDAHPDLCQKDTVGPPLHSDWLRRLIDDGLDPRRIVGVGWRDAEYGEREFLRRAGVRVIAMSDIRRTGPTALLRDIEGHLIETAGRDWRGYVTIDMDVADPSIVPGATTLSPGGLDQHQFTTLLLGLSAMKNIRALDVVEIDPRRDESGVSILWVLKVLREMA